MSDTHEGTMRAGTDTSGKGDEHATGEPASPGQHMATTPSHEIAAGDPEITADSLTPASKRKRTARPDRPLRWLLVSQSIALFGSGILFPFYIVFTKEIGANFTQFGLAYAIFSLTAALTHAIIGRWSDRMGRRPFLVLNAWGTAFLLLVFPIVTTIGQVYVLQAILGVFGAMQRTSEKALVADLTDGADRGRLIGAYHGWVSIASAAAVVVGGVLIDLFTLSVIFYVASPILFVSGLAAGRIPSPTKEPTHA